VPGVNGRISSATVAQLISQSGGSLVSSVFGRTGVVVAKFGDYTTDQITEGRHALYFSIDRVRKAIALTTFNTSGPATYDSVTGILNIPQYGSGTASPTNFVPLTRTITINGQTADLSRDRIFSVASMVYPSTGIALSNGVSWEPSIVNNSANWNTAYGWGNHALAGYALDTQVVHITGAETVAGLKTFTSAVKAPNFILSGGTGNTGMYFGHTDRLVLANYGVGGIDFESNGGVINGTLFPSGNWAFSTSAIDDTINRVQVGGYIIATGYRIPSGTASQFLKANGSIDSTSYTPTSRTLTINGTAYDLSADRAWTIAAYILPIASATVLGGIKVGTNLSIDANGVLSANDTSVAWTELTGVPSTFTPSVHTHAISDITTIVITSVANDQLLKYNSTTAKWENWTPTYISSYTDTNTTYSLTIPVSTTKIRLTGSDASTSDIIFTGSGATTITRTSATEFTISSTDTDTVYVHPTTAGNKHIPAGGSAGQILRYSSDGTAAWGADNDTTYTLAGLGGLPLAGGIMTGAITLKEGAANGLKFPNDVYGGSGDTAGMRLITRAGESMSLEVYLTNDADDWFNIAVPSDNGAKVNGNTIWHAANLTNLNQLTNGPGYITSYVDTNTWDANSKTVAGYVAAPGTVANKVWKTDGVGNPAWRDDADTDTIVTSLAWTSITGRPTALSSFTNDLGNYGGWVVRTGDSMSGRLTIDTRNANDNLPLYVLSVEPYIQLQATGTTNSTAFKMYPTGGSGAYMGNYATGELVLVAANTEAVYINSNSLRVAKYRFNGNATLSGNGTAEIVDVANVGMTMQSLNYKWYNNLATVLYMTLDYNGNLTANAFFESSDIRYKDVIETNPNLTLEGLDVIKFTRKGNKVIRYGYSAQQVKSLSEDLIGGTNDDMTVNYSDVHTLKIAALEKRIAELEAKLK
jgi:hypothetical protein